MFDFLLFFFFQAEDGIRDADVTGVQTCALPISQMPIEEYDPSLGIWVNKTLLVTGVANTGAVSVNNLIYIVGGYTGSVGIANLQIYNPATNTVTLGADMPDINYGHTV